MILLYIFVVAKMTEISKFLLLNILRCLPTTRSVQPLFATHYTCSRETENRYDKQRDGLVSMAPLLLRYVVVFVSIPAMKFQCKIETKVSVFCAPMSFYFVLHDIPLIIYARVASSKFQKHINMK